MLDDPGKTSRLLAALKASLPFEVHLTPPLARLLRERRVALAAGGRQTGSVVAYLGDAGGIVRPIVPPDGGDVAFVSLTHVRVPPSMPLAAEVLRYQKHRVKKLVPDVPPPCLRQDRYASCFTRTTKPGASHAGPLCFRRSEIEGEPTREPSRT